MWEIKKDSLDQQKWMKTIMVDVVADKKLATHGSNGALMLAKRLFLKATQQ